MLAFDFQFWMLYLIYYSLPGFALLISSFVNNKLYGTDRFSNNVIDAMTFQN